MQVARQPVTGIGQADATALGQEPLQESARFERFQQTGGDGHAIHRQKCIIMQSVLAAAPTMREFMQRTEIPGSSRALGWDTMLPTSSCGTLMSARAFGHTGFTGTSLWVDPGNDVYVVLLTNRVHPDSSNDAIQEVRRAVHDAVMRELTKG